MGISFVKGHGTQNDFVLLPDLDATLDLTPARVRVLCDRQAGLGADGVLRVVRAKAIEPRPSDVDDDVWFMDYRNADGSVAEMCGNGVRVFARYLLDAGLVTRTEFPVGSRAGVRNVVVGADGEVAVEMGPVRVTGESAATLGGRTFAGVAVNVGNPHLVCPVDRLDDLDLSAPPGHDAAVFPDGVNVEFVESRGPRHVAMRVFERGVGETWSCGTGACAAVAAAVVDEAELQGGAAGLDLPASYAVDVNGGTLTVTWGSDDHIHLKGPAELVASGTWTL